jgi:hypothetical protein
VSLSSVVLRIQPSLRLLTVDSGFGPAASLLTQNRIVEPKAVEDVAGGLWHYLPLPEEN